MTVIGITGPSGSGKGEASLILSKKYGFHLIDADSIYHSLVSSSSKCLDEIKNAFGYSIISNDGTLDRSALSKMVFGDENREKLLLLNKITHKYVVCEIKNELESCKSRNMNCIIDAPLLFEAGLDSLCDFTVSIIADCNIRINRVSLRDKISLDAAKLRISSQKTDSFYIDNSDYTITNNDNINSLEIYISKILSERRVFC